jgi:hypothetical protein
MAYHSLATLLGMVVQLGDAQGITCFADADKRRKKTNARKLSLVSYEFKYSG